MSQDPKILFAKQLAARIPGREPGRGVSLQTLWRWVRSGEIPAPRWIGGRRAWTEDQLQEILRGRAA